MPIACGGGGAVLHPVTSSIVSTFICYSIEEKKKKKIGIAFLGMHESWEAA
jgi:hypothetical protein